MSGHQKEGASRQPKEDVRGSPSHPALASGNRGEPYRPSPLHAPYSFQMQGIPVSIMGEGGRRQFVAGSPTLRHPSPRMARPGQQLTSAMGPAVTPDSRQFAQPEMMSPPFSTIRTLTPGSTPTMMASPAKRRRGRMGTFIIVEGFITSIVLYVFSTIYFCIASLSDFDCNFGGLFCLGISNVSVGHSWL